MPLITGSTHSGKYYTDCYLKYRKWTLQEVGIEPKFSIRSVLADCIKEYELISQTQQNQNISWSPIHLAALLNDITALEVLIKQKGINVDSMYTNPIYTVTPLACATYTGGLESVEFLIANGADAFKYTRSLVYWTVKGGSIQCLNKIFESNILNPLESMNLCSLITRDALGDNLDTLRVILKYFPQSAFQENRSGQTTVYLAAQRGLPRVLRELIKSGVAVNKRSKFQLSPLYAVVHDNFSEEASFSCLQILLDNGARIDYEQGQTSPLYHAAIRGFSKCVFDLIKRGAIINVETLEILNEKIPNFIQKHLDGLVTLRGLSNSYSKILVCINLRFTGTINSIQPNLRETSFLNFLIKDGQHKFLLHPVIETYLTIKWLFVRKFFFASVTLFICMLLCFSSVVLDIYVPDLKIESQTSNNGSNRTSSDVQVNATTGKSTTSFLLRYFSIFMIMGRVLTNAARFAINPRHYLSQLENWILVLILVLMLVVHFPFKNEFGQNPQWQTTTAAIAVFGAWAYLLNFLRRHPTFGIYVEMFYKVIVNLIKLLLTYTSLLIGYAISFMILYEGEESFGSLTHSTLRVLNMMVGEMGFDTLFTRDKQNLDAKTKGSYSNSTAIHTLYILFVLSISIALINLLIGLAVSDIKGLQKRSKLNKTMREVAFIVDLESFLFYNQVNKFLPKTLSRYLKRCIQLPASYSTISTQTHLGKKHGRQETTALALISRFKDAFRDKSMGDMHMIHVYPNDSNDKRLSKLLKQSAFEIALKNSMEVDKAHVDKQNELEAKLSNIESQLDYLVRRKQGM